MDIETCCRDFLKTAKNEKMNLRQMQNYLACVAGKDELIATHGNQSEAARNLGINRLSLKNYIAYETTKS